MGVSVAEIEPPEPDSKPDSKPLAQPDTKSGLKPEPTGDFKRDSKPRAKSEPKPENKQQFASSRALKSFYQDSDDKKEERSLNISGTKTFEMKKAKIKGDIGHFSTENFDSIPGFHLDQSLHLEIDGNITKTASVKAVLDDKDDEDRRFTINIDGPIWDFTMGDFPISLKETEFALNQKEVRGIMAQGSLGKKLQTTFLYSQSKGVGRREQFRGAGQQQEFRLLASPVVQNSERVAIDGHLLSRGSDYLIDYEEGVVKLLPHLLPVEITSWITAEYEVSDTKLAFKRTLMGTRLSYNYSDGQRVGFTWLREADDTTPKTDSASGTVRPMEHNIIDFDGVWRINRMFSISGEHSISIYDPNRSSEDTEQDKKITDHASKFTLAAHNEKMTGELSLKRIGKDFKLVGREGGVTELGERGLVSDILKESGRFSYAVRPQVQLFAGLEKSKTNLSNDSSLASVDFTDRNGGINWKYKPRSQLEARYDIQKDKQRQGASISDKDKAVGALVWDHNFGKIFSQSKVENTKYTDAVNTASGSSVLQTTLSLGSDLNKKISWSVAASKVLLDDDLDLNNPRSDTRNYTLDLNYEPNRIMTVRGILQWRNEDDFLVNTRQKEKIADSRIRYQPNNDLVTQFKYKVENTSKVVRDPSLDPAKYINPPSLPVTASEAEEIVGRYENPVQKTTSNFNANYRFSEKTETTFDWKRRDLKDRATHFIISLNDRKTCEVRYNPIKQINITSGYETGTAKTLSPITELNDAIKRIQIRNEFFEGYIFDTRFEHHNEDDVYNNDNDRRTLTKSLDFQRVFSKIATLEAGIQRNIITYKLPSKEWEERAAFILTPSAKNQRYKLFLTHKQIEAAQSGNHFETGLNFSQFIGTDSMLEGEVKKVKSTATASGNGYDGMVANAKMVITF